MEHNEESDQHTLPVVEYDDPFRRHKVEIDYNNKVILAPMVRICSLPFRLAALEYGADIVYSEEIVDRKLCNTKRVVNVEKQCVDYLALKDNSIVNRVCPKDTPTVLQIGTASSEWALKAAQHAYWDYDAVDVNMGCPMKFSTHGGMGSGLLKEPEKVKDVSVTDDSKKRVLTWLFEQILSTLVRNIDKPVTCKIRLRDNMDDTLALVKLIESTGVKALAVHGRYIDQRPEKKAHMDLLPIVKSAVSIPMIANGDVFKHEDIEKVKQITTCSSVMVARGALWNCSVFQPKPIPAIDVALDLFDRFIYWDNSWSYSKYLFQRMFVDVSAVLFDKINTAKTFPELKNVLLEYKEETSRCKEQPAKSNE